MRGDGNARVDGRARRRHPMEYKDTTARVRRQRRPIALRVLAQPEQQVFEVRTGEAIPTTAGFEPTREQQSSPGSRRAEQRSSVSAA